MKPRNHPFALASLAAFTAVCSTTFAADLYKDSSTTDLNLLSSWSTVSGAATPDPTSFSTTDNWYFNDLTMGGSKTVNLGASTTIGGIDLDNTTAGSTAVYNVIINATTGQTLTLNGASMSGTGVAGGTGYTTAGIVLNRSSGGTMTINADIIVGANQQWVTSRGLTVGGAVNLNSNTLSFNTAGANGIATLNGVISGAGSLNKTAGAGTLALGNTDNTFTGTVTLVGGTTTVTKLATGGNNSSLGKGSSAIVLNGAALTYLGTTTDTTDRAIDMRAGASINNNGTTGVISFTAANVIQGGTASARTLTLGGTNANANTFSSVLGDSGTGTAISTLQKSGGGTWLLNTAHTYTGSTIINQGILRVTGSGALGGLAGSIADAGNIWFSSSQSGGTLEFETNANLGPADQIRFRNTGGTAGAGAMLKYIGTTAQVVTKAIQCDTNVGIRLNSDSVLGSIEFSGSWTNVAGNRPIYLGGTGSGANKISGSINANGTGTLTKVDSGRWILTGTNTYTGKTTINDGVLEATVLADGTVNSSIGASGNGSNNLVFGSPTAVLRYIGSTASSSARGFTMSSGPGGGATIESSAAGTGSLELTAGTAINYGTVDETRVLTLGGTSGTGTSGSNVFKKILADNGTGATSLVKNGAGFWEITIGSNPNTYSGGTTINAGVLRVGDSSALGSGGVALNGTGADLRLANGVALTNALTVADTGDKKNLSGFGATGSISGTVTINETGTGNFEIQTGSTTNLTLSGTITGTGAAGITKTGDGTLTVSGANDYTGGTVLAAGTVALGSSGALGTTGNLKFTGGTLQHGANNTTDYGARIKNSTSAIAINTNGQTVAYAGAIDNSNTGGLTKSGTGTLTLSASNGYTGPTAVNNGTLVIAGSIGSAVTIASGATLGGTGTITGNLTATGSVAPGNSIGTLNLTGDVTWNGAAGAGTATDWKFELAAASGSSDKLAITGNFNKNTTAGSVFQFNFLNSAPNAWGNTYTLATWTGTSDFTSGTNFTWSGLTGSYTNGYFTLNSNSLTFTAIPEPTSALAGLLLGAGLLRRRRQA